MWDDIPTNKKVGVMWPNDADGNAIRAALGPQLKAAGYTIIDPGAYEDGTNDYSAQIAKFKAEDCQIFNTFPIPPDFATFWKQAAQQGYVPKIAQIAKTGLFPSQIEALGDLGLGLASAAYWTPTFPYSSTLLGTSSADLASGYTASTGRQWNQDLGTTTALFDAATSAIAGATDPKDKVALAAAIGKLKITSTIGKIDFTSGPFPNVSPAPIIGGQWIKDPTGKFKVDFVSSRMRRIRTSPSQEAHPVPLLDPQAHLVDRPASGARGAAPRGPLDPQAVRAAPRPRRRRVRGGGRSIRRHRGAEWSGQDDPA